LQINNNFSKTKKGVRMRFITGLMAISVLAGSVLAQGDTMYIYSELSIYTGGVGWDGNGTAAGHAVETDTGTAYNGTAYINFDYTVAGYWAGFGIVWDGWMGSVDNTGYNALCIAHKGPTPPNTINIAFAYVDSAAYNAKGAKAVVFNGSTSWIAETKTYGDTVPRAPIRSMNFIISGTETSPPGNFKLDEIAFVNSGTGARMPVKVISKAEAALRTFIPTVNGTVSMSALSLNGSVLAQKNLKVTAGNSYQVPALMPTLSVPSVIQIQGAGVDKKIKNW
jgi:hypothetical protein